LEDIKMKMQSKTLKSKDGDKTMFYTIIYTCMFIFTFLLHFV
jgi:hypothetical protein